MNATRGHWFRFKLSTVLILTAIAACAMALRPFDEPGFQFMLTPGASPPPTAEWQLFSQSVSAWRIRDSVWIKYDRSPKLKLLWPALALAIFLTWRAGWTIVARRKACELSVGGRP
jgi:hypothetical protein